MNKRQKQLEALQKNYDLCEKQYEAAQNQLDLFVNGEIDHPDGQDHFKYWRNYWRGELFRIRIAIVQLESEDTHA